MAKYATIYARISQDSRGQREGVDAQEAWGRAYCAEHWPDLPVAVFSDNDLSASKESVRRPGFEDLREAIRGDRVAQLWAVEQSRLTRVERVWFELATELVTAGIDELHTNRDGVVRIGDVVGGIKAVLSAHEVRRLRDRINDRLDTLAAERRHVGYAGFGYRQVDAETHARLRAWQADQHAARQRGDDLEKWRKEHPQPQGQPLVDANGHKTIEPVPEEAAAIRDAAQHLLDGWTLAKVAEDLNRRGLVGGRGGRWDGAAVKRMIVRPKLAGLRVHRGEVVGKGRWEPILDEATHDAVVRKLGTNRSWVGHDGVKRTIAATRPNARKGATLRYLLTSVAVCGVCKAPLAGTRTQSRDKVTAVYRCFSVTGGKNCTSIRAAALEDYVTRRLMDQLDKPDFLAAPRSDDHARRRDELSDALRAVERRRTEVAERWQARKLSTDQFDVMNDGLLAEERELRDEMAALPPPPTGIDPTTIREGWHTMTHDERRQVITTYVARVVVHRRWDRKYVTRADVAQRLGVSGTAVTKAVSGTGNLSDALRERILAVVDEMGYRPVNPNALLIDDDRVTIEWRTTNRAG